MTVFQICPDSDMKTNAIAHILASMLNGPAFNYLRTDQKLGYTVRMTKESTLNVSHISIFIQSTKYDPDYVESKVNLFLRAQYKKYSEEGCKASIESNKTSIINHYEQKPQNLKDRAALDLIQLSKRQMKFDLREKQIEAIR